MVQIHIPTQGILGTVQILRNPPRERGESPKRKKKNITEGRGHQKITADHNRKGGRLCAKKFAKLKVFKKEIFAPRVSYQWLVQEVHRPILT